MEAIKKIKSTLINDKGDFQLFSPIRGRHYLMANGNTVTREIFYDSEADAPDLPVKFLIPGFERIHRFKFTFKSLMSQQEAERRGLMPLLTFEQNIRGAGESDDDITVQKMCMVTRTIEDQHYLLDREVHPFEIVILSSDNSELKFVFTFTLKIDDANKVVSDFPGGNAMGYAERLIISELNTELRTLEMKELLGRAKGGIKDNLQTVIDTLNNGEFGPHGFTLLRINHEATIIPTKTQERINAAQEIPIAESKKEIELIGANTQAEVIEIKAKANANAVTIAAKAESDATETKAKGTAAATETIQTAEIKMQVQRTTDVGKANTTVMLNNLKIIYQFNKHDKGIVDATQQSVARNLKDLKGVLILGEGGLSGKDDFVKQLIANSIQTNTQNLKQNGS
jgi:regulator of protease activity HflC (stomatin/prohibitin superfamily)